MCTHTTQTYLHYQLVNGVNYFIKVKVGGDEAVHVRAHKGFQDPHATLHSIQSDKKVSDDLEYF
jgi:hypothetical protein